jgi:predicted small secreted protein
MKRLAALLLPALLLAALAGCATFRGMGEDLQNLGKGIKESVK